MSAAFPVGAWSVCPVPPGVEAALGLGLFAWQSGWVFALRSAALWADPATAAGALSGMAAEKQRAWIDGWAAASRAALRGAGPGAVAAAASAPARRRVAANLDALTGRA